MTLAAGTRLGPYEIVAPLGSGGMGEVYRARDTRIGRDVAIKLASTRFTDRFDRETRAIASLNHPNICTLYDLGPNYLVTELVEGETLSARLESRRAPGRGLPVDEALSVARQVLEALDAAHCGGFIHRDLKPQNIVVRRDGYVKVLDFGLAKQISTAKWVAQDATATQEVTLPGQILGTVSYMSPEQIREQDVDQRSDLFAFGTLFYELLVGRHPWRRRSPVETLHAILHEETPALSIAFPANSAVPSVVQRLLKKNPAERYSSARAVLEALFATVVSASASPTSGRDTESIRSIAVLPFVFLGEPGQHQALSLGFADALIAALGNLETVVVTPTSATCATRRAWNPAESAATSGFVTHCKGTYSSSGSSGASRCNCSTQPRNGSPFLRNTIFCGRTCSMYRMTSATAS
jgi:serine/threonine protein kinase